MRKVGLILLSAVLLFGSPDVYAKRGKSKKSKKTEVSKDSSVKKESSKYKRTFKTKACETAKGDFLTLHWTKGKIYFEMPVKYLGREVLIASTISGASDTDLGMIGYKPKPPMHVKFVKMDSLICMSKVNVAPRYDEGDAAMKKAIGISTLDPILNTMPVFCYTPDSSAVVFDMTTLFTGSNDQLSPMSNGGGVVSVSGTFNSKASTVTGIKAFEDNASIKSYMSYSVSTKLMGMYILSQNVPVTFQVTRTILLLPEQKMRPRVSDSRIGIFNTNRLNFDKNEDFIKTYSMIHRWNLQPKDTAAYLRGELVEPVKPIVFYLDDAFPAAWAKGARMGILRWNKAFEKIGFKNVIQILDFPKDDPNFDPDNLKYSCIRYVPARVMNAMGPSWVDPSTGEVINASVLVYHDVVKLLNQWRFVQTAQVDERARCKKMDEDMVTESIAYILAHEVGHCLGFMHNMAASVAFPVDSLRSASFTQKYGTTPSIMDYARFNYVAQPGDKGVKLTPPDLGVYDYYLVEYAYKPIFEAKDEMEEIPYLEAMIDAKAGDPLYRYGRQQVSGRYDPSAVEEDLGDDAIKASDYGVKNLKYILAHMNEWITDEMDPDGSYREMTYENLAKQYDRYFRHVMLNIGGIYLTDLKAGTPGERVLAVEKSKQKAALKWVINELKNCDWLDNEEVTKNFGLRVGLAPIMRYYTGLELFNSYSNVIFSSHIAGKEGYSPKEYFDDLYSLVWESAIKKNHVPESDRMLQRLFLERAVYVAGKATKPLQKVGLTDENSVAAAYAPSVDEIITMGLDESGVVERYKDVLRELEMKEGSGVVARKMAQDEIGYGYGWQYRVNLRSIDNSKDLLFGQLLRVQSLLKARMGAVDTDTKAHFKAMLYLIEEALDARSK